MEGKPKEKEAYPEAKASSQKSVDEGVIAAVKGVEHLASYLKATWSLSKVRYFKVVGQAIVTDPLRLAGPVPTCHEVLV